MELRIAKEIVETLSLDPEDIIIRRCSDGSILIEIEGVTDLNDNKEQARIKLKELSNPKDEGEGWTEEDSNDYWIECGLAKFFGEGSEEIKKIDQVQETITITERKSYMSREERRKFERKNQKK